MRRLVIFFVFLLPMTPLAHATNYYVDCFYGSNGNPGSSPAQAWRTLLEVGISSFQPGDTVNLRRDCVWNETLTPPSSGTNPAQGGALIKIDAYGNGQPPHLTGSMPVGAQWWTQVGGTNVWSATLYSATSGLSNVVQCGIRGFYCLTQAPSQLEFVRFGTVWGIAQASQSALAQDRDWWYDAANFVLYVYSAGGNPATHYGQVAPIVLSGGSLLNLNNVSWLEIQHLQMDWFDAYGAQIQGASDHLWLANMVANSEIENGTAPLGFYVHPGGTPVDIHLYNTDANMNYTGYRFDGCGSGGCATESLLLPAGGWSMTRAGLRPVARQTRAYFAAVDPVNGPTAIFDPSKDNGFQLDAPPAPWLDLGWIENFERTTTTQIEDLAAGPAGAVAAQARHELGARIDFEFRDWGKLQMALAGGAEHMNALASDPSASRAGSGGNPLPAAPLQAGSTAAELVVGAGAVSGFQAGDLVACDVDYAQQVGYVGTGIAAAYVQNPTDVRQDVNYVRRVTFNVGRVAQTTATSLVLDQALPGGAPAAGASVQKVIAFVDRDGGKFLQQWSALFVVEEESGGRVCFFYPMLSPATPKPQWAREKLVEIAKPIGELALPASFIALPTVDDNDSAVVLCYRSYFPANGAAVY